MLKTMAGLGGAVLHFKCERYVARQRLPRRAPPRRRGVNPNAVGKVRVVLVFQRFDGLSGGALSGTRPRGVLNPSPASTTCSPGSTSWLCRGPGPRALEERRVQRGGLLVVDGAAALGPRPRGLDGAGPVAALGCAIDLRHGPPGGMTAGIDRGRPTTLTAEAHHGIDSSPKPSCQRGTMPSPRRLKVRLLVAYQAAAWPTSSWAGCPAHSHRTVSRGRGTLQGLGRMGRREEGTEREIDLRRAPRSRSQSARRSSSATPDANRGRGGGDDAAMARRKTRRWTTVVLGRRSEDLVLQLARSFASKPGKVVLLNREGPCE